MPCLAFTLLMPRVTLQTVTDAQNAAAMKPGVSWPDMHRLMWRVLLEARRCSCVPAALLLFPWQHEPLKSFWLLCLFEI